jgi:hypothetical protein
MIRVLDHRPRSGRPHFSVPAKAREHIPVHKSSRPQVIPSLMNGYNYTEADRQADVRRSLRATLAIFALLATGFPAFLGLAWIVSKFL